VAHDQYFFVEYYCEYPAIEGQGFPEVVGRGKSRLLNYFLYAFIKPLHHTIGLRAAWFYEAIFNCVQSIPGQTEVASGFSLTDGTESVSVILGYWWAIFLKSDNKTKKVTSPSIF